MFLINSSTSRGLATYEDEFFHRGNGEESLLFLCKNSTNYFLMAYFWLHGGETDGSMHSRVIYVTGSLLALASFVTVTDKHHPGGFFSINSHPPSSGG